MSFREITKLPSATSLPRLSMKVAKSGQVEIRFNRVAIEQLKLKQDTRFAVFIGEAGEAGLLRLVRSPDGAAQVKVTTTRGGTPTSVLLRLGVQPDIGEIPVRSAVAAHKVVKSEPQTIEVKIPWYESDDDVVEDIRSAPAAPKKAAGSKVPWR
jgi:hypothetical protein